MDSMFTDDPVIVVVVVAVVAAGSCEEEFDANDVVDADAVVVTEAEADRAEIVVTSCDEGLPGR